MTASLAADYTGHDLPERIAALAKTAADAIGHAYLPASGSFRAPNE